MDDMTHFGVFWSNVWQCMCLYENVKGIGWHIRKVNYRG
jgi:hypothetical protein